MATASTRPTREQESTLSTLDAAIHDLNLRKEATSKTLVKTVHCSVCALLNIVRDSMVNRIDYVELGLFCADVCKALDRGLDGRQEEQFNRSVFEAIEQLTAAVAEIQRSVVKLGKQNAVSRLFHVKDDKHIIGAWKLDLNRILHVFNTELAINTYGAVSDVRHDVANTHDMVFDIHRTIVERQERFYTGNQSAQISAPGESPPPIPRACFGRDEWIGKIVGLAENLTPIALIGPGGIGKTSVALAVLHHSRIQERFGDNRRFIRCDQFPASRPNFLRRLSKVIGAGVENPEDLIPLRPFLSSKEIFIVLDNAESILDPQGASGQETYGAVEELSQFNNICLCITSRITTIPPHFEALEIPTLSMEAAHDTFYRIYKYDGRSDSVQNILKQLDFHPLSVTLLATVAFQNKWDDNRLAREWEQRQTGLLQTGHNRSLAGTIELSLASPMFKDLGPDARGLLEVIAFFPKGINENNLDWLFPTLSNGTTIFDKFCVLSLTYRSNGFIKMLAPLRDYLRPKDPKLSPLLHTTKERYFTRMSVALDPDEPGFKDARWIELEHVNVEHLLDVFTSIDADSNEIWEACAHFLHHLYWHKKRQTMLRAKIEGLPDDHPSKPVCLLQLSRLFQSVGNNVERKRLLAHALRLERERGNNHQAARTLMYLSDANRLLYLREEGIQQAGEALEIFERLGSTIEQAECLNALARLLHQDKQFDAAEAAVSRAIVLLPEKGQEFRVCQSHRALGGIHRSKREREKVIHHFEIALRIASPFNWNHHLFWIHHSLARLFSQDDRFDDAHAHIEQAKSHATENAYRLGTAIFLQAEIWYQQHRFQKAMSQALHALDIFEKLGSSSYLKDCRKLLGKIEKTMINEKPERGLTFKRSRVRADTSTYSHFPRLFKQRKQVLGFPSPNTHTTSN